MDFGFGDMGLGMAAGAGMMNQIPGWDAGGWGGGGGGMMMPWDEGAQWNQQMLNPWDEGAQWNQRPQRQPMNLANAFANRNAMQRAALGGSMVGPPGWAGGNPFQMGGSRGGFPGGGGFGYGGGGGGYGRGGYDNSLLAAYNAANERARAENLQRFNTIAGGYRQMNTEARDQLNQLTNQGQTDINNLYNANQDKATQDLISKGLGNTTVTSSVSRGIENDRAAQLNRWRDAQTMNRLNTLTPMVQNELNFWERRNDTM